MAVALPRLALLPFNENVYGDAIPRTEMAERWMTNPHLITAFGDGAGQYGPLHLYLVGTDHDLRRPRNGRPAASVCSAAC